MFRKKNNLSFSEQQYSIKGIFSAVLAAIALVICLLAVFVSYNQKGGAGSFIGGCGVMALLSSAMGIGFGIGGIIEGARKRLPTFAGTIVSVLIFAWLIMLFAAGMK